MITEAEKFKRWQKYTEELYGKGLNNLENHDGVVTHLESQTSRSVKSGGPKKTLPGTDLADVSVWETLSEL